MSDTTLRGRFRYRIEERVRQLQVDLADRIQDSEALMRVEQGRIAGLIEAAAIHEEVAKQEGF